jgi:hypothetical protein
VDRNVRPRPDNGGGAAQVSGHVHGNGQQCNCSTPTISNVTTGSNAGVGAVMSRRHNGGGGQQN